MAQELGGHREHMSVCLSFLLPVQAESQPQWPEAERAMLKRLW